MRRILVIFVLLLGVAASATAQPRFTPPHGTLLPAFCGVGDLFVKTSGTVGLYVCTAVNTWSVSPLGTASGGTPGGADTQVQFNEGGVFGGNAGFTFDNTLQDIAVSGLTITGNSPCSAIQFSPTGAHCDDANDLRISYTNVGVQFFNEFATSSILTFHDKFDEVDIGSNTTEVDFNGAPLAFYSSITGGDLHILTFSDPIATGGSTPAVANVGANSCGTTAAAIAGNDNAGTITVGATSGSQCRVTFVKAATTRRECTVTDETTTIATRASYVDVSNTDFLGSFGAGDLVSYVCFAR